MTEDEPAELKETLSRWESVRERWELSGREEAALIGVGGFSGNLGDTTSWGASRLARRMRMLVELAAALDALLVDGARIRAWLRRPRRSMNGRCPLDVMSSSEEWIISLLNAALDFAS